MSSQSWIPQEVKEDREENRKGLSPGDCDFRQAIGKESFEKCPDTTGNQFSNENCFELKLPLAKHKRKPACSAQPEGCTQNSFRLSVCFRVLLGIFARLSGKMARQKVPHLWISVGASPFGRRELIAMAPQTVRGSPGCRFSAPSPHPAAGPSRSLPSCPA